MVPKSEFKNFMQLQVYKEFIIQTARMFMHY